ncbi:hypothetical protein LJR078_002172 [Arthrobacter sp. LjRoot78]|uniref:hypothetical protein n=1 Tax=Arthrobacter sp. LjRoot78 TaxID=3342338 RepID=UPI003ED0E921
MENGVTDRLWDKAVQEFIAACRQEKLSDIALTNEGLDNGQQLAVSATYLSRKGRSVPVGFRWTAAESGLAAEIYVGKAKAPAGLELDGLFRLALRAGLWMERRHVAFALLAVTDIHSTADGVRGRLELEYLKTLAGEGSVTQARDLTLQTLNDLAYLYGSRSAYGTP